MREERGREGRRWGKREGRRQKEVGKGKQASGGWGGRKQKGRRKADSEEIRDSLNLKWKASLSRDLDLR